MKLLSTGEFAKLVDVAKHTIIFYDNKGIFKPYHVNEKGYRQYSIHQVESFSVIKSLRELGMSLADIHDFLKERSPQQLVHLLTDEARKLEKTIDYLIHLKTSMHEKMAITQKAEDLPFYEIFIEQREALPLFTTQLALSDDDEEYYQTVTEHYQERTAREIYMSWVEGFLYSKKDILEEKQTTAPRLYTPVETKADANAWRKSGDFLVVSYQEKDSNTYEEAKRLIQYAQERQIELDDYFYEDLVLDQLSVENSKDYVYTLSIRIKSSESLPKNMPIQIAK